MTTDAKHLGIAEAVVIRPGDKLIIRVSPRITAKQADDLREWAKTLLPELADVLIVGADQIAVLRSDED